MTSYIPSLTFPSYVFSQPAVAVLVPVLLGTAVGYSTRPKETQSTYLALKQPPLRPPPYVFGPAWTTLYALMGYAAHRAYTTGMSSLNPRTRELTLHGATLYTIQLGLNLIWMPLFFRLMRPVEATVDILALTGIVTYMTYIWSQVDEVAGYFLVPYLGWLGFATYLCIGVGHLNDWNLQQKRRAVPPTMKSNDSKYVNEKDD